MKIRLAIFTVTIAIGSMGAGYKWKGYIQENIYLPFMRNITPAPSKSRYKEVNCPKEAISIAIFGQSNSGNTVKEKINIEIPSNVFQYDWKTKKCYYYKEPLLGTMGRWKNIITYTAAKMAMNSNKPIIIIPFGVGGSSVLDWAYGDLSHLHRIVMERIKESDLSPRIFLWHQGENDSNPLNAGSLEKIIDGPYGTDQRTPGRAYFSKKGLQRVNLGLTQMVYYNALKGVTESTLQKFPQSSFGIALATRCGNNPWDPVRNAQMMVARDIPRSFISADSDSITGPDKRPDDCHFSAKGASELGDLYYESINREIKRNGF
ncbi:sialate O-acetylesterase [bacterium]|nr:sialate O-acetylesterase [bacterium]